MIEQEIDMQEKEKERYKKEMEKRPGLYSESLLYLLFAYRIVSDDQGAYEMLKKDYVPSVSTTLGTYLYAAVLYRTGRNEESLELLYSLNTEDMEIMFYPIVQLIAREKCSKEIATELKLSVNSVHTYRERLLAKAGVKNTAGLIYWATKNNLI